MKPQLILTTLLISLITTGCISEQTKIVISDTVSSTEMIEEDIVELVPPPGIQFSKSHRLNEFFSAICKNEHPKVTDTLYHLHLYKINEHFVVFFIDANSFKKNAAEWSSKRGRDYLNKYYQILDSEFPDQNWQVVVSKIRNRLSEYSKTAEFRKSALARLKPLSIQFNDAVELKIN